jgi:hypothetical protein
VFLQGQGPQRFFQVLRTQFGCSASGFDHGGEANLFFFRHQKSFWNIRLWVLIYHQTS